MDITVENYEEKRNELVIKNSNLVGVILSKDERKADELIEQYKSEYREACGGKIPYSVPVLTDKRIKESRLYSFLSAMPKGADLHVHDMAELPFCRLFEFLLSRNDFYIDVKHGSFALKRVTDGPVPDGYMLFSKAVSEKMITEEKLLYEWTVLAAEKNGMDIWDCFEELFVRHAALSNDPRFAVDYYDYAFRYYCGIGIMHVEIHLLLCDELDRDAAYIKAVREAYYNVRKDYPWFRMRFIGAGFKADNDRLEATRSCFLNTAYAKETIKDEYDKEHISDLVIGFDLVNEEDTNLPLSAFAPMLIKAKQQFPDMKFFIHSGESLDTGNENLIDAYLLGVTRVGHGLNLYKYPDLLERYARSEICLEVCVISNQTLGYTRDIRNHPAAEYIRRGVSIALCSDDPTYQENETLTDDFFAAAVCWDLKLADLKTLAINSIVYSGLDDYEKNLMLKNFGKLWKDFISEITSGQ